MKITDSTIPDSLAFEVQVWNEYTGKWLVIYDAPSRDHALKFATRQREEYPDAPKFRLVEIRTWEEQ